MALVLAEELTEEVVRGLAAVEHRIAQACARAGRDRGSVRLLPVSKAQPGAAIAAVHQAGIVRFGENKPQELQRKAEELALLTPAIEWVAIGHLQSNKAKLVAEHATEFQALDSVKIAEALQRKLDEYDKSLDVLIQVNTSGEESKSGVATSDVAGLARQLVAYERIRVRGLMTLAAHTTDQSRVAQCFRDLAGLADRLRASDVPGQWDELSMGMSGDFELAISQGSTCVRIGSAIFGARE